MSNVDCYPITNKRICPAYTAGPSVLKEYEFYFKSERSKLRYCIGADYHEGDFFAVKYYCKSHKLSKNKYSLATNSHEPFKILRTCLQVIPELRKDFPTASFVAVGARAVSGNRIENPDKTIRYQLYDRLLFNQFSQFTDFMIARVPEISGLAVIFSGDIKDEPPRQQKRVLLERTEKIKSVVLQCYNDIHLP